MSSCTLQWTPLSRPLLVANKLTLDGVLGLSFRAAVEAAPCHSGPCIGARVASLRSLIFRASALSVKQSFWRESDKSQEFGDGVPESSNAPFLITCLVSSRLVDRRRSPIPKALMQALLIVKPKVTFDASSRFRHCRVVFQVVEWRGASQPRALPEPDVNLSIHPAPIIRPLVPGPNVRTALDCDVLANATSPMSPLCGLETVCIYELPIAQ